MSFFSGIVDGHDHIRLGGYPAPFRELLGLQIEDFVPMATGETNRLDTTEGETSDLWADLIHLEGAEPLASYTDDFYAGTPTVTRNTFGAGAAYYRGIRTDKRYTKSLLQELCDEAGISPSAEAPPGVDAVRRKGEDASFLFVLNHNQETGEVQLPQGGRDLLTGKEHQSKLTLDPLDVAILQEIAP
jgi:beta-galactosidase